MTPNLHGMICKKVVKKHDKQNAMTFIFTRWAFSLLGILLHPKFFLLCRDTIMECNDPDLLAMCYEPDLVDVMRSLCSRSCGMCTS
jgi:ShK domain-like